MELSDTKVHAVLQHYLSLHEADAVVGMLYDTEYTSDDIIEYLNWIEKRYGRDESTDFDSWLDDRKPRVRIEFFVTECGTPIHEKLEFPKRGEDMEHGTEFEWYYSLREVTDQIMALKVGESMPFKIRDDKTSHGAIVRIG